MKLLPLVRQLSIRDKNSNIVPFEPNWAQQIFLQHVEDDLNAGRPLRYIILKARQLGMSTITEAVGFCLCMINEGTQGLIVAHEVEPSQHLLSMSNLFWDTYPFKPLYKTKYESTKALTWTMGSSLRVTTASTKAGRGRTIHFLHGSEVAFWRKPEETWTGLRQTVPNTAASMIVMESTPNGVGNFFHNQWKAAESEESEYTALFFPWHKHPEYLASANPFIEYPVNLLPLDKDERQLQQMGLSDDRLTWRRWAIKNLCEGDVNKFKQEYPATPEEGFVQSGTNVFGLNILNPCYDQRRGKRGRLHRNNDNTIKFIDDTNGPLTIYANPSGDTEWGQYIIGADPTRTTRGDFACAQILNRRTLEQVAIWRAKIDPGTFATILAQLGQFYNWAMIVPEIEGPGYMTVGALNAMQYPNIYRAIRPDHTRGKIQDTYGWSTTMQSKHLAISWLIKMLADKDITIHDRETYNEMANYVTLDNGSYGPGTANQYDDAVMALAIACAAHFIEGQSPMQPYGSQPNELYLPQPSVQERVEAALMFGQDEQDSTWGSWSDQMNSTDY